MSPAWIETPCPAPSASHEAAARARQAVLTKPAGSLGTLEALAITLAALQATERPRAAHAPIILFAGDHGVTAQGVSAYPAAVTVEMLKNFASGGAAVSVLARTLGVPLTVVDAGTLAADPVPGTVVDKPRRGTRDFTVEPAMTDAELDFALAVGQRAVERAGPADLVLFGEMGIGNTTSAAAIAAALLAKRPAEIAGAGTGLDAAGVVHKIRVIEAALARHALDGSSPSDPRRVLATVGGLEIAALTGAIIASAQARRPVLVDGFIVTVAALAATRLNPSCVPWLIYSHRSAEQGHGVVLDALAARPVLDLNLRLGEGSGAATALAVLRLACELHNGMATFEEAAVSGRSAP
ncbi:nicotinate-nucleotide--dimethylbenzimidazole phosphoribosyltransferase [Hyphomicrobium sp.]|uniref:nicotinate-nucleotide--dimethylbenzimidazole phosphoribosyltransferase n=1 Tax=Hyphomicrobium sp. TaxID=82 RepID=UPI0025B7F8D4|nr:nicotinate-nucleotide--dimethylbenzimidazole phosphoribosyltransferase [Hyphomicrobium sp.]MCC7254202.1 nicotinate-nucleotide--dimethylbenzimidazole phosphoribosyltransferase [Hyphomicrobium sp.]